MTTRRTVLQRLLGGLGLASLMARSKVEGGVTEGAGNSSPDKPTGETMADLMLASRVMEATGSEPAYDRIGAALKVTGPVFMRVAKPATAGLVTQATRSGTLITMFVHGHPFAHWMFYPDDMPGVPDLAAGFDARPAETVPVPPGV